MLQNLMRQLKLPKQSNISWLDTYSASHLSNIRRKNYTIAMASGSPPKTDDKDTTESGDPTERSTTRYPFPNEDESLLIDLAQSYSKCRDNESNKWLDFKNTCHIYLYRGGGLPKETFAGFDLDGTIIKPKGRSRVPKSATDWQFFSVWTKLKIEQTIKETKSRFVIFTNQNGVGLGIVTLSEIQERIELVTKRINIPCTVFVATEKDRFRKPNTHMFHLFDKAFNDNIKIDREKSFYCGDAIGYPSHSDADIKFARALNLPFITPDKYIRGVEPKYAE